MIDVHDGENPQSALVAELTLESELLFRGAVDVEAGSAEYGGDAVGANANVPSKTPVQELDVDSYKNLKAGEAVGDGLEHDHSYNDPEGETKFYKFINSGLEFGFRSGKLNHIHFFVQCHEGYSEYTKDVLGRVAQVWSAQDIVNQLGPASTEAPGRVDMLIGYVQQWLKYEFETYDLRMEFSESGRLWKVTLMANPMIHA